MNDFTKEELIVIRDNIVVPEKTPEKGIMLNAYRKIVMMIEDYCDHDFEEYLTLERDVRECKICGREESR